MDELLKAGYVHIVDAELKGYFDSIPHERLMARQGIQMVRYADDFVILCRKRDDAEAALAQVQAWVAEAGLTLHPTKTRIVDSRTESFAFLGYEFRGTKHWPRRKSLDKLKDSLRPLTRRTSGTSLEFMVGRINSILRGWFGYFKHSSFRNVFQDLDGWIRGRLRGILRKRRGSRGRGRGSDHQRWPNAFFAKRGLFSLVTAHATAGQSSRR